MMGGGTPPSGNGTDNGADEGFGRGPVDPSYEVLPPGFALPAITRISRPFNPPVDLVTIYDAMRREGWHRGDGSFTDFVVDLCYHALDSLGYRLAFIHYVEEEVEEHVE